MTRKILVVLCFSMLQYSLAQSIDPQADSLLQQIERTDVDSTKAALYNDISNLFQFSQPQKSIQFAHKALHFSKQAEHNLLITESYLGLCLAHYYHGSSADSIFTFIKLLEDHVQNTEDYPTMMQVHWMYAFYYHNLQQQDKEVGSYLEALEIAKTYYPGTDIEIGLLQNIGAIYSDQEKYAEALPYFEEGLKKVKGDGLKADMLNNIGEIYYAREDYDKGLPLFEEAFSLYEKVDDKGKMAATLVSIGEYHDDKEQFERANQIYSRALQLVQDNDANAFFPDIYHGIAAHYQSRSDHQQAIVYGEKALVEMKEQQNYEQLISNYELLHESYAARGDYKRAYEIRSDQIAFLDSTNNIALKTKVEALQTQFAVEQKESENKLLRAETAANQKTIQNRTITVFASLLGILLIGSWAIVVFRANRRKQKYNKKLETTVAERTAELQEVNKDLEQANYELKMFNYIASHDIKEPIRNIGSYISFIFRRLPESLQLNFKQDFGTIKKSASQLYTLVEDFSKYSQLSKDKSIEMQEIDLNKVVDGLEMNLKSYLDDKNGKIIVEDLPTIKTNASFIHTILKNIIENGLKFNRSVNPTVKLSATTGPEAIEIIIKDNGIGIEPAYQEQIFEMFKRLHNRKQYDGSGIGLAIVKLLMDKMNGSVSIESKLGQGSTFTLKFPSN